MAQVKLSDVVTKYGDSASGDFAEWLEKLELVARLQKVDDLTSFLPLFLHGPAFAVYKQLKEEEKDDYTKLKAALLRAFGVDCYTAYEQLQRRVLQENETVDVYLADIQRLVTLMGQGSAEPLLKCAFMAGLPADVSIQLKAMAAVESLKLDELITRARMMLSTRNPELACAAGYNKPRGACFTCGSFSHMARECPKSTRRNTPPAAKQVRRCFVCNDTAHIARICPNRSGNGQGESSAPGVSPGQQ